MKKTILLLLLCGCAYGQGVYLPSKTVTGTVNGITRPVSGATITVCAANTGGIPCAPALANTVYQTTALSGGPSLSNPFPTDQNGNYPQAAVAPGTYTITESAVGFAGFSYQITIPIAIGNPASFPSVTTTGAATIGTSLSVGTSASIGAALSVGASASIIGPSPWFDVSANSNVDCTQANPSDTGLNAIITAACANPGSTIYFPDTCQVKATSANFSSCSNVNIRGQSGGLFGAHGKYNLTLTCTTGPCLNLQSSAAIHFYDMAINFPNLASGANVDISGGGSGGFHHAVVNGSGTTQGPLFLMANTNYEAFDNWTVLGNASVIANGASNASPCCSDLVIFDHVKFGAVGTSVMQNSSINWTVSNSNWLQGGSTCPPFMQYTGISGAFQSTFNWYNSSITGLGNCSGNFTLFTFPAVSATNPTGGVNFQGGTILGNSGSGQMTLFNLGNGQSLNMNGTVICGDTLTWNAFQLGTGVTLNVKGNHWEGQASLCQPPSTFYVGGVTPTIGSVTDNTGATIAYGVAAMNFSGNVSAVQEGLYSGNNLLEIGAGGFGMLAFDTSGQRNRINGCIGWSNSGTNPDSGTVDTCISRIAPNVSGIGSATGNTSGLWMADGNKAVLTADWTCGTGGTVSTCATATIIGSGGGVPMTFTLPSVSGKAYQLDCDFWISQTTALTANGFNLLTATNGATNVTASYGFPVNGATAPTLAGTTYTLDQGSTTTTFQIGGNWTLGALVGVAKYPVHLHAAIEGASASGTVLSVQLVAPTPADLLTFYRGGGCHIF